MMAWFLKKGAAARAAGKSRQWQSCWKPVFSFQPTILPSPSFQGALGAETSTSAERVGGHGAVCPQKLQNNNTTPTTALQTGSLIPLAKQPERRFQNPGLLSLFKTSSLNPFIPEEQRCAQAPMCQDFQG